MRMSGFLWVVKEMLKDDICELHLMRAVADDANSSLRHCHLMAGNTSG